MKYQNLWFSLSVIWKEKLYIFKEFEASHILNIEKIIIEPGYH